MGDWKLYRAIRDDLEGLNRFNPRIGEAYGPIRDADGQLVVRYEVDDHNGTTHIAHVLPGGIVKRSRIKWNGWIEYVQTARSLAAEIADLFCCESCDSVAAEPEEERCPNCGASAEM